MEQKRRIAVQALMKSIQTLIPRITERQSEVLRQKLSDYVATLIEKNAARLSKYEKPVPESDTRPE